MQMYLTTTDNIIRARGILSISYEVLDWMVVSLFVVISI